MVATLKLEGDTFSFADPAGMSYAAKLDGTETPFKGDLSQTMVSVKRIGENTIDSQTLFRQPGSPSIPNSFVRCHAGPSHISRQQARMEPPERV